MLAVKISRLFLSTKPPVDISDNATSSNGSIGSDSQVRNVLIEPGVEQTHLPIRIHTDTVDFMNYLIQQTQTFVAWHSSVRDLRAKIAIARRIDRAAAGNLGDV